MHVTDRQGHLQPVKFDRITEKLNSLSFGLDTKHLDPILVAKKVVEGMYDGIPTAELDQLAAETAAYLSSKHPDFGILAARIAVNNLHKSTEAQFSKNVEKMYLNMDPHTGEHAPLVSQQFYQTVQEHAQVFDGHIKYERDYEYDYFGYKTLERSYLIRMNGKIVERPQQMLMRVAVGIHGNDLENALKTYDLLSEKWFTHASPTLFNAGTRRPQLSSCFLLTMADDSIEGIYETLKRCALISQSAGGIGLSIHNIRGKGTFIRGTNGTSNGIVPMLRVFNDTARYVDQGGGKRKGAFAIYLEPWHSDIFDFLELKKNHGKEEMKARDLFYAMWIPDLFMKRVEADEDWSLFCPKEAPGLADCHGKEFEALYQRYEQEGRAKEKVKARKLWFGILQSQIETGLPYMLYKDHANEKSNQKNLGTIKSSNLCTEIMEYTSSDEVAVCNLASIALSKYVVNGAFDFQRLFEVAYQATINLNKIIDINYYPVPEAQKSNLRHRPIGIGVQGLADTFALLKFPFEGDEAKKLNRDIFETIYFAALSASSDLAERLGTYETYPGSPISQGLLQFDLWGVSPSDRWDWDELRGRIKSHGVRNSLLIAPMPTASTSQILGNNECFEPFTSNIYNRRVLSGEFTVVNKYLVQDLLELNLWDDRIKNKIIANNGSVQNIEEIPADIRELYKTVWEIKQKTIIDLASDRGAFIDQSQSLNIHMEDANFGKLSSMHFHAWKKGLKTGMYYLRTRPAASAIKFTVTEEEKKVVAEAEAVLVDPIVAPVENFEAMSCSLDNPEDCISCGS